MFEKGLTNVSKCLCDAYKRLDHSSLPNKKMTSAVTSSVCSYQVKAVHEVVEHEHASQKTNLACCSLHSGEVCWVTYDSLLLCRADLRSSPRVPIQLPVGLEREHVHTVVDMVHPYPPNVEAVFQRLCRIEALLRNTQPNVTNLETSAQYDEPSAASYSNASNETLAQSVAACSVASHETPEQSSAPFPVSYRQTPEQSSAPFSVASHETPGNSHPDANTASDFDALLRDIMGDDFGDLDQSTESPILDASFWSENGVSCSHERNKIGDSVL
jgi:hypothetical protein